MLICSLVLYSDSGNCHSRGCSCTSLKGWNPVWSQEPTLLPLHPYATAQFVLPGLWLPPEQVSAGVKPLRLSTEPFPNSWPVDIFKNHFLLVRFRREAGGLVGRASHLT